MASRVKEDEKNERIIRSLIKLPGNRRCINCNSLGPQYVCTNFWTFICTTCSGIHREFTHRVKSISMATFTSQEVASLQGGGNERAREVYLKEWDLQRLSFPDSSNIGKLRDFIKHVYVDRRYAVDKNPKKSPNRKTDDTRSPGSDGRRYSESSSTGGKSPGHELKTGSSQLELVSDWRREDRFTNGRNSEEDSASSSPVTRPVRDILGDNAPLRIVKPPSTANIEPINTSTTTASLIDFFDSVPGPGQSQLPVTKSASVPTDLFSVGGGGGGSWASFDSSAPTPASNDPLEAALAGLTVPAPTAAFPPQPSILEAPPTSESRKALPEVSLSLPPTSESRKALPEDVFTLQYAPTGQAWYGYGAGGLNPFEFPLQGAFPALPVRPVANWAAPYPFHVPPGPNAGLPPNLMPSGSSQSPSGPRVFAPRGNPFA